MSRASETPKKWKRFEELVAKVQKDLTPDATVTLGDQILGKLSGATREVDISIRQKVGQFDIFIAIDCKDYADPVDIKGVEEFIGMVQDIGANKAALVSASGFTPAAKTRATEAGLSLYRVIDAGQHDWQTDIAMPALWDFRYLQSFRVRASTQAGLVLTDNSLLDAEFSDGDGKLLGRAHEVVHVLWNRGTLPSEPGVIRNVEILEGKLHVKIGATILNASLNADLVITRSLRFGYVPLAKFSGFENQISNEIRTRELETATIDVGEVERTWQAVKRLDDLAAKPMFREVALKNIGEDLYTGTGMQIFFG